MNANQFLPAVRSVHERLRGRPDMFEVTDVTIAPPVDEQALDRVERDLRVRLPETLRAIYTGSCASVQLDWFGRRGKLVELGCDAGDEPRGSLELCPPERLARIRPRTLDEPDPIAGLVQFTVASNGSGYCIHDAWREPSGRVPIVWFDLDEPAEPTAAAYPCIEDFLDDWAACGFVNHGNSPYVDYAYAFFKK
jgi:hypothetical protein